MESLSESLINTIEKVIASREDRLLEYLLGFQNHVIEELISIRKILKQRCLSSMTRGRHQNHVCKCQNLLNNNLFDKNFEEPSEQSNSNSSDEGAREYVKDHSTEVFQKDVAHLKPSRNIGHEKDMLESLFPSWLEIGSNFPDKNTVKPMSHNNTFEDENCGLSKVGNFNANVAAVFDLNDYMTSSDSTLVKEELISDNVNQSTHSPTSGLTINNSSCAATVISNCIKPQHLKGAFHNRRKSFSMSSKFDNEKNMSLHSIHGGSLKKYKCSTCGKLFSSKSTVQKHAKLHDGVKPYSCKLCGKAFSEKFSLKRHLMIHTGEKPFKCSICNKSYSRKDYRDLHMKLHWDSMITKRQYDESNNVE